MEMLRCTSLRREIAFNRRLKKALNTPYSLTLLNLGKIVPNILKMAGSACGRGKLIDFGYYDPSG